MRIHPFAWSFLKPILAGAAGVMVIWGARFFIHSATLLADVIYGLLFAAIYVAVIWLLKLEADDLLILKAIERKTTGLVTRLRAAA